MEASEDVRAMSLKGRRCPGFARKAGDVFCMVRQWLADGPEGQQVVLAFPEDYLPEVRTWAAEFANPAGPPLARVARV